MTRSLIFAVAFIFLTWTQLQAQNNPGTTSTSPFATPTSDASRPFRTLQPAEWIGKRFVFLPTTREMRQFAYPDFQPALQYSKYVGRIAKVESITGPEFGRIDIPSVIQLVMEDNGERLQARCVSPRVSVKLTGLALVDDITQARKQYLGKRLYLSFQSTSFEVYDKAADSSHSVIVKKYSAVVVKDVVAGSSSLAPVRFILRTPDGTEGFIDVNMSNTNPGDMSHVYHFEDKFLTVNPRVGHRWTRKIWKAIEAGEVHIGMTEAQVRMALGEPENITVDGEGVNWQYSSGYGFYFERGVVKTIGDHTIRN